MSARYGPPSRRIWTLQGGNSALLQPGQSAIAASGNSGGWPSTLGPFSQNQMTSVDLRDVNDIALLVAIQGATGGTPSLTVNLDLFDDQGNMYPAAVTTGSITTGSLPAVKAVYGGAHATSGSYVIFPDWGRVSWVLTGSGSLTGAQIGLWAR